MILNSNLQIKTKEKNHLLQLHLKKNINNKILLPTSNTLNIILNKILIEVIIKINKINYNNHNNK